MKILEPNHKETIAKLSGLVLIIAIVILSLKTGCGMQLSVFFGAAASIVIAFIFHTGIEEIYENMASLVQRCTISVFVLLLVNILIGVWVAGGAIPALIYYGLTFISPALIVPITFLLCVVMSLFTGTSFGSIATMGVALYGVGVSIGVPSPLLIGAVVSGAFFGDKMSPMSDTTNLAAATTDTPLYSHVHSMLYTTLPAAIISLILYAFLGIRYTGADYDASTVSQIMSVLSDTFNIRVICVIPLLLLLILSFFRLHVIIAMSITLIVSILFAVFTQGVPLSALESCVISGYLSDSGYLLADQILTRGGMTASVGSISIVYFSAVMGGALQACGILEVFKETLLRLIHSGTSLVLSTLAFCYLMICITGNQMLGIVIPGIALSPLYDRLHISKRVLSRSLEDAATIGVPLIPWSAAFAYISSTLDADISYVPYAFLCWLVPVFSVIYAVTGFAVWHTDQKK